MTWRRSRCLAAFLVLGDALLPFPLRRGEFDDCPPTAGRAGHTQRARWVQLFVAGDEASPLEPSTPLTLEEESAARAVLASAVARGQELLLEGSLHEAADVLQRVLAAKHDEPGALLHLAEVFAQLGQPRRAVVLADRLLSLAQLTAEAQSFTLNRRGLYQQLVGDWIGARESYELALECVEHSHSRNRLALWNLARLLHFHVFPSETLGPDFSTLERAIELYRAALGRDGGTTAITQDSKPRPRDNPQGDSIGGPIDRSSIARDLAAALSLAGRPGEAVAELENVLIETDSTNTSIGDRYLESETGGNVTVQGKATSSADINRKKTTAFLWDSLASARRAAGDLPGAVTAGQWFGTKIQLKRQFVRIQEILGACLDGIPIAFRDSLHPSRALISRSIHVV